MAILDSIVVSIPACHAGDRGSIPRRGGFFYSMEYIIEKTCHGYANSLMILLITDLCFQFHKTTM